MRILITEINHKNQRYDTAGDWQFIKFSQKGEILKITVSKLTDPRYYYLVAIHEFIEAVLCKFMGITEEMVDKWDFDHPEEIDPGSLEGCPYRNQHELATLMEKRISEMIGVDWNKYEAELENLC